MPPRLNRSHAARRSTSLVDRLFWTGNCDAAEETIAPEPGTATVRTAVDLAEIVGSLAARHGESMERVNGSGKV